METPALSITALVERRGLTRSGAVRVDAIDLLRGLVVVLMVLDHTREFFSAASFDPTDPERASAALFATRWVTHLCAPTFVFLAGVSIHLQKLYGKTDSKLAAFLLSRGVWLITLEVTVVSFALNFGRPFLFLEVVWAIGAGMIAFAFLSRLPNGWILSLGVLLVAGNDAFGSIPPESLGRLEPVLTLLVRVGSLPVAPGFVAYPVLPWLGVMCLGYGLTPLLLGNSDRRWKNPIALGLGFLVLFAVLRLTNQYGDQRAWALQSTLPRTVMSFLRVSKYPPSLDFVLATLGVSLLLYRPVARIDGLARSVLAAFGRTPLFVFVTHLMLVHALAVVTGVMLGYPFAAFTNYLAEPGRLASLGWGLPLPIVYAIWLGVLAAIYPMSSWLANLKRERRDWWLGYI
jgi:uncharacterized membrane protein